MRMRRTTSWVRLALCATIGLLGRPTTTAAASPTRHRRRAGADAINIGNSPGAEATWCRAFRDRQTTPAERSVTSNAASKFDVELQPNSTAGFAAGR